MAFEHTAPVSGPGFDVLVSDGGYEQSKPSLATVRALAAAGYRPVVTVSGRNGLAASSKFCAARLHVPSADDAPDDFARAVTDEMARNPYVTLLPTSDVVIR